MSSRLRGDYILALLIFAWVLTACAPPSASGDILFQDDFEDPTSGWQIQSDVAAATAFLDGEFQIAVLERQLNVWSVAGQDFADVNIAVEARTASGPDDNAFGVICRYQDDDNFYFMMISADGFYGVGAVIEQQARFIHGENDVMDFSEALLIGRQSVSILASCSGETLTLSVDGSEIATATATEFSRGDIGLIAKSFLTPGVDVRFDNLTVTQP